MAKKTVESENTSELNHKQITKLKSRIKKLQNNEKSSDINTDTDTDTDVDIEDELEYKSKKPKKEKVKEEVEEVKSTSTFSNFYSSFLQFTYIFLLPFSLIAAFRCNVSTVARVVHVILAFLMPQFYFIYVVATWKTDCPYLLTIDKEKVFDSVDINPKDEYISRDEFSKWF